MQICCPGSVSGINNVQFRENIFLLEEAGRQGVDEYFFRTKIENMYKNVFLMHGWWSDFKDESSAWFGETRCSRGRNSTPVLRRVQTSDAQWNRSSGYNPTESWLKVYYELNINWFYILNSIWVKGRPALWVYSPVILWNLNLHLWPHSKLSSLLISVHSEFQFNLNSFYDSWISGYL